MSWSLAFEPIVPPLLVGALALIGAALLGFALIRQVRGTILRAAALAALVVALLNPVILSETRDPLGTVVALVVDDSDSQEFGDRTATTEAMRAALAAEIADLGDVELRTIRGGQGAADEGTTLFTAADEGLADIAPDRIGAVIMLTDGEVHDVPSPAADTTPPPFGGAPIHALIAGRDDERDRRVAISGAPRFGIVGEQQTVTFRVLDPNAPADTTVPVRIRRDGELLSTLNVTPGAETRFPLAIPHGGTNIVEIEADEVPGELTTVNNRAILSITGIRENLRVLLVSGEPHAGERTWRDLLKSDPAVDLIHFTILRPPEKQDAIPVTELSLIQFPTFELFQQRINDFDLIIFDRYQERGVLPQAYFDNIADYVEGGGALLVAAGPDDADIFSIYRTALADILPAVPDGGIVEAPILPTIAAAGERHPVTRDLPGSETDPPSWGHWLRIMTTAPPTGDVVMEDNSGRPLLVLGHAGEGRAALLLSDEVWLWARGYEGGGPHVDLLRRLAHWLMQEPDLEEEALRASARGADLLIERQTMADTAGPVTVRSPSGAEREVPLTEAEPGLWRATVPTDEVGLWEVIDGPRIAVAAVGPANPKEFENALSTPDLMAPAVADSGGHLARMATQDGALTVPEVRLVSGSAPASRPDWLGIRLSDASVLKSIDRQPLLAGFLGLALLLGLLALAWYREGR